MPASRRLGRAEALSLAGAASRVIVAKGNRVVEFRPGRDEAEEIADAMLGPTGNLRAPTIRVGKTVVVGYNDEVYQELLGA